MHDTKLKKASTYGEKKIADAKPFNPNESALLPIFAKANILNELNKKIAVHLDSHLQAACAVANVDRNRLILLTSSGSHATQLRFQIPELLRKFNQDAALKRFTDIQILVRPEVNTSYTPRPRKLPLLSKETAALMQSIAETCSDPKLKEVLSKIAKNKM